MVEKNFERVLPKEYREIKHIDAREKRFAIGMNAAALVVLLVCLGIAALPIIVSKGFVSSDLSASLWIPYLILVGAMLVYIVLHELVHGVVYKVMTGEKLTFGLTLSCAFCGVPDIYVYRKTALRALVAPLLLFTVVLVPLTVWLYYVDTILYFVSAFVVGLHIGGCSGDIYMTYLLLRNRDPRILVKDTGPAQSIYAPAEGETFTEERESNIGV